MMKYLLDRETLEVFGFELDGSQDDLIKGSMVKMTDEQFNEYQRFPSSYHVFDAKTMSWQITKANQAKLAAEQQKMALKKAMDEARLEYDSVMVEIQTLSRMIQLGRGTDEHKAKLQSLEQRSFDLYDLLSAD